MQSVLDARKAASDAAAAAKQAAACKPSAVDNALKEANKQAMPAANSDQPSAAHGNNNAAASSAAATLEAAAASGANTLDLSVQLLAGMRWAGLDQLDAASGKAKKLAVYRCVRVGRVDPQAVKSVLQSGGCWQRVSSATQQHRQAA